MKLGRHLIAILRDLFHHIVLQQSQLNKIPALTVYLQCVLDSVWEVLQRAQWDGITGT